MRTHTLYHAVTRSAKTYGGVPAIGFGVNFFVAYLGYMSIGSSDIIHFRGYMWPVGFCIIHVLMVLLVEYDPSIFRIIQVMFDTLSFRSTLWSAPPYAGRKSELPHAL